MNNTMSYKGYVGSVEFSENAFSHNQSLNSFIEEAVKEKLASTK